MSLDTTDAPKNTPAGIVNTGIKMHREVLRRIKTVAEYRGLTFQEWALAVLVREMQRDLDEALASLRD